MVVWEGYVVWSSWKCQSKTYHPWSKWEILAKHPPRTSQQGHTKSRTHFTCDSNYAWTTAPWTRKNILVSWDDPQDLPFLGLNVEHDFKQKQDWNHPAVDKKTRSIPKLVKIVPLDFLVRTWFPQGAMLTFSKVHSTRDPLLGAIHDVILSGGVQHSGGAQARHITARERFSDGQHLGAVHGTCCLCRG